MSAWSNGMLERIGADSERCRTRTEASRALVGETQNFLIASREVRTRTRERLAQNPRKLHAAKCPVTENVTYAEECHGAPYGPVDDRTVIAENLRQARLDAGLTVDKLAGLTDKSRREIIRWEKGVFKPSHTNLLVLAGALGHESDPFWFYVPHPRVEDAELAS